MAFAVRSRTVTADAEEARTTAAVPKVIREESIFRRIGLPLVESVGNTTRGEGVLSGDVEQESECRVLNIEEGEVREGDGNEEERERGRVEDSKKLGGRHFSFPTGSCRLAYAALVDLLKEALSAKEFESTDWGRRNYCTILARPL